MADYHGSVTTALDPRAARPNWETHRVAPQLLFAGAITCDPHARCVIATLDGDLAVLDDATLGTSRGRPLNFGEPGPFDQVACPTPDRCIAANEDGAIRTTVGHNLKTWRRTDIDQGAYTFDGVACPSAHDCVLADYGETVLSSTSAFSPHTTWLAQTIDTLNGFVEGITCPSTRLCLAFDQEGRILRTLSPFGQRSDWKTVRS